MHTLNESGATAGVRVAEEEVVQPPLPGVDVEPSPRLAVEAVQGIAGRLLVWAGALLSAVGVVTTARDLISHHHGIGLYLLAGGLLLLFLATLDMWRVERKRTANLSSAITSLRQSAARLQANVDHLTQDRDHWVQHHAAVSERYSELLHRQLFEVTGGQPQVGGSSASGTVGDIHTLHFPQPLSGPYRFETVIDPDAEGEPPAP